MSMRRMMMAAQAAVSYSTWNPSDKHANITLSNGNMRATTTTTGYYSVRSTSAITGKRYFEFMTYSGVTGGDELAVGVATDGVAVTDWIGQTNESCGIWWYDNRIYFNGAPVINYTNSTLGVTQGYKVAIDTATRKVWIGRTDLVGWPNSGDPAAGTLAACTLSGTDDIFAFATPYNNNSATYVDLVSDPSDMIGSPPSGFTAGI